MKKSLIWPIAAGVLFGAAALLLAKAGNPPNMGLCIACFLRDTAGALHLHGAEAVQFVRPEIAGLLLGSFAAAAISREFKPVGGSSPMTRFAVGAFVMAGALMFLGCPLRMILRLGGGDFNALFGLIGFAAGIGAGAAALNRGFTLGRAHPQGAVEGAAMPFAALLLLGLAFLTPALFASSQSGPGSMHAPAWLALSCALACGAAAQRSRLCTVAGIRDAVMFRDFTLLWGVLALLATVLLGNLITGSFNPGFANQPVAHTDGVWNFLGMALAGWSSALLGGCPLRQLILAGQGNSDSAVTVLGMLFGAAACHNFGLASSAAGPTPGGMIAVGAGLALLFAVSVGRARLVGKE